MTYTLTDESPALATYSFLPIVKAFLKQANINVKTADISLAGRVIAAFASDLKAEQRVSDDLKALGELVNNPSCVLIKTPNISASVPQLKSCIKELQSKGYALPNYPDAPQNESEQEIWQKYQKILGSAVNPVLRQGNSIRRCSSAVKQYARCNPYKITPFNKASKTRISSMKELDFYATQQAVLIDEPCTARIVFKGAGGEITTLKENLNLEKNEILDCAYLSAKSLDAFYAEQIALCKEQDLLLSLHLKATMMKISDPVIFGHCVKVYFKELFSEFKDEFARLQINANNGLGELLSKIENSSLKEQIKAKINEILAHSAPLSMLDSAKNISNLNVPSDVIVDASMPAMLKNGAKLWDKDGALKDTNALIPDRTYASIYEAVLEDLHKNGALDPATLGSVSNIGLMAKKAQEYGSHDKTFIASSNGRFEIISDKGETLLAADVEQGDIFRACEAKFDAVLNWIDLGIESALEGEKKGATAIFWLDSKRANDKIMIDLVKKRMAEKGANIEIMDYKAACLKSLELIRAGKDAISITGNVLRDYLTDLFPILELGTSAKMLSIVPMLQGGAMFETGAGGSAPKQVAQLVDENHLRWDSLGEFLALQAALEFYAKKNESYRASVLAATLDEAISTWLEKGKAPSRKAGEADNRTSHYYLASFWANELARQGGEKELQANFKDIALELSSQEEAIMKEYLSAQGRSVDLGGYYKFDDEKAERVMRASSTFNAILEKLLR